MKKLLLFFLILGTLSLVADAIESHSHPKREERLSRFILNGNFGMAISFDALARSYKNMMMQTGIRYFLNPKNSIELFLNYYLNPTGHPRDQFNSVETSSSIGFGIVHIISWQLKQNLNMNFQGGVQFQYLWSKHNFANISISEYSWFKPGLIGGIELDYWFSSKYGFKISAIANSLFFPGSVKLWMNMTIGIVYQI